MKTMAADTTPLKPTVRTVTVFVNLQPEDFKVSVESLRSSDDVEQKIAKCAEILKAMESELMEHGYTVQTLRVATNPFGEWLLSPGNSNDSNTNGVSNGEHQNKKSKTMSCFERLDQALARNNIETCSVGPATNPHETSLCVEIVSKSPRFSCSSVVDAGDVVSANHAAETILAIAKLGDDPQAPSHVQNGLGNFRFCSASSCKSGIPFFPAAKAASRSDPNQPVPISFALGLENGTVAQAILRDCKTVQAISSKFSKLMQQALLPLQELGKSVAKSQKCDFLGIDSSLNPSLQESGSVAAAMEELDEIKVFGGPGTLGAAAEITKALQSLEDIDLTGYCGLMLPVCEDTRLAQLGSKQQERPLRISNLLNISSVCGVGVDTVPVPSDCSKEELSSLILDVAAIAGRWDKSLSCRVFPVPGKRVGEMTEFDSPYLVNTLVFPVD